MTLLFNPEEIQGQLNTKTPICHSICISKKIIDLLDVGIFDPFFTPCSSDASRSDKMRLLITPSHQ
jgi:hypothetical protein